MIALDDRHLALIGMAGVGKSTVARRLAARLGRPLHDLDAEISAHSGRSVGEIFAELGEAAFRDLETQTLAAALAAPASVIATGGGVVIREANRRMLADGARTVWLRAEEAVLVARLERSRTPRPLLAGDVRTNVARLLAERDTLYEECADVVVDIEDRSIDGVVELVMGVVG